MNFASPGESWAHQRAYYAWLESSELAWTGVPEYRGLVEVMAASRFAERLYAIRSHDHLRVPPTRGWVSRGPKWVDRPWILLRPLADGRVGLH